jgi:CxxC motif-containing protein (DUF1111 family)
MGFPLYPPLFLAAASLALAGDADEAKSADAVPALGTPGAPTRELVGRERERWLAGRAFFLKEMSERDGLGPAFNATSCGACHLAPVTGGAGGLEFNVAVAPEATGGKKRGAARDDDAISRYLRSREVGQGRGLTQREIDKCVDMGGRRLDELVANTVQTPSILGLGALERVHEDEILGREDPHDRDGDGVRGVAQRVRVGNSTFVGRFGWRADLPTLNDFARAACGGELGLTVPAEVGFGQTDDGDLALDPEMTWGELDALVFFCRELAPPARGGRAAEPEVALGERAFDRVGCAVCHVPTLYGADGAIHPYTDLLLHAVAPRLPRTLDRKGEPAAFRTPPLWGIAQTAPYLHDGRAATLADAIAAHEGEAEGARKRFDALAPGEREALLAFLADL